MIWRIRARRDFQRLQHDGRRARAGALWCTYVFDPSIQPPRVAYTLGRALGPAVVRNRLRRRLRAGLAQRGVPPGLWLIGARPPAVERSYSELMFDLDRMLAAIRPPGSTGATDCSPDS